LAEDVDRLTVEIADLCANHVPALADPELRSALLAGCEANLATMLTTLKSGRPVEVRHAPPGALALSHEMVHLGVELAAVLSAYRLAHAWFQDLFLDSLRHHGTDADELGAATMVATRWVFGYIETVTAAIADEYELERQRWLPTSAALRDAAIRSVLADERSAGAAGTTLGYDFDGSHVAMVAWLEGPGNAGEALSANLRANGLRRMLVHPVGESVAWAWVSTPETVSLAVDDDGDLFVAIGMPEEGPAGFRRSHDQALEAQRVSRQLAPPRHRAASFDSLRLEALLTQNVPVALAFVRDTLGRLGGPDPDRRVLQQTVLAFLDAGSAPQAAKALGVHHNTVLNRIRRAEDMAPPGLLTDRLKTHTALHLSLCLGPAARDGAVMASSAPWRPLTTGAARSERTAADR
jgi:hypothetical protein